MSPTDYDMVHAAYCGHITTDPELIEICNKLHYLWYTKEWDILPIWTVAQLHKVTWQDISKHSTQNFSEWYTGNLENGLPCSWGADD